MATCVKVFEPGYLIGSTVAGDLMQLGLPMIGVDPSCAAGMSIYTQQEIYQLKQTLTVDSTVNPERVADMLGLFYIFLGVLVTVWGVKQLLNLFSGDTDRS